ncbi:MAG: universal stress protein [Gemmatimonadales bacterium]
MINRILVAVDFRQSSLAAAWWAATQMGQTAEVELAHVAEHPAVPHATRALEGLAETLRARRLSVRVLEGPRVPALVERAVAIEADLVVLGCGSDGSGGAMLEGLARLLAVPVLVVPASATASSRRREAVEALIDEIGTQSAVRAAAAARRELPEAARATFGRALPSQLDEG